MNGTRVNTRVLVIFVLTMPLWWVGWARGNGCLTCACLWCSCGALWEFFGVYLGHCVFFSRNRHQLNERYDDVLATLLSKHHNLHVLLVGTSWWNGRRENALGYGRLVGRVRRSIDRLMDDEEDRLRGKNEQNELNELNEQNEDPAETTASSYGSSSSSTSSVPQSKRVLMKQRVRHITGLSRPNYLSLLAAVNVVLDPVTEDGSGTESGLLMALETMMIGTPIVTLRPKEEERGWARVQPTSVRAVFVILCL